jgi:SAM-dependent methyltransferase
LHQSGSIDSGRAIDWGRTSTDYARYRPGPPDSYFQRLAEHGVGLAGQRILDLGTGTGALARRFAAAGATVAGIDISPGQIEAARRLAAEQGIAVDFRVAPAEAPPFGAASFDLATANQCWIYFDAARTVAALRRVLGPRGRIVVGYFNWLPGEDAIARETERLVLAYNPAWTGGGWDGSYEDRAAWATGTVEAAGSFVYDEAVPFTAESWRGRMRACRGTAATLEPDEVARFDADLEALLARIAGGHFTVLHRIEARFYRLPGKADAAPQGRSRNRHGLRAARSPRGSASACPSCRDC